MAPRFAPGKCRNTLRITKEWLLSALRPSCWKIAVLLLLLEQDEYLGLLPYSERAETLEFASTHNTQKAQRAFLKWTTPENTSLEDLRYPPKGHADAE